jgi:hypothetical protein
MLIGTELRADALSDEPAKVVVDGDRSIARTIQFEACHLLAVPTREVGTGDERSLVADEHVGERYMVFKDRDAQASPLLDRKSAN